MSYRIVLLVLILIFFMTSIGWSYDNRPIIEKKRLIEDIWQLSDQIEATHPDPYINGGGKIAYHRRLHKILTDVPDKGMTKQAFFSHLLPFFAPIGDGHTTLCSEKDEFEKSGFPIRFDIVGKELVVLAVKNKSDMNLLGARLKTLAGVPYSELVERQKKLWPYENAYGNLSHLAMFFSRNHLLKALIPEWSQTNTIKATFILKDNRSQSTDLPLLNHTEQWHTAQSKLDDISAGIGDFAYGFLDAKKKRAWLKIDGMSTYREHFESVIAKGWDIQKSLFKVHNRFNPKNPPQTMTDALTGIPSATLIFQNLVKEMKENKTDTLIVDLSENGGGNSLMAKILVYFLHGKTRAMELEKTVYDIPKYSDLYFKIYKNKDLWRKNTSESTSPIRTRDYDFTYENKRKASKDNSENRASGVIYSETFKKEWDKGTYAGYYRPKNVVVISTCKTYSAGFDLMVALSQNGAVIVGSPSAQAGNCFIDKLNFKLKHSGIFIGISYKQSLMFPDDPVKGRVFEPDYPFTYEQLARYDFDPKGRLLYALDIFKN